MTKAIIQTNGKGTVYSTNYANGDKSKLKKVDVISGESGTFVCTAVPKDNYAFAGVYISGKSVKVDVYDLNAFSVDYPASKAGKDHRSQVQEGFIKGQESQKSQGGKDKCHRLRPEAARFPGNPARKCQDTCCR
jgi:hypothetical protein